ncbi:hypothetical protein ACJMK2_041545 [Sinanodonta woodiana]|uniref:Mucolipin-3 n=1 Tax=Sinanodonta woodiana TaxID=1069815 RepID=A0ABD3W4N2_SINWO
MNDFSYHACNENITGEGQTEFTHRLHKEYIHSHSDKSVCRRHTHAGSLSGSHIQHAELENMAADSCIGNRENYGSINDPGPNCENPPVDNHCHAEVAAERPPLKRVASIYTPYMEDRLRRRLKFFFMGPDEKYRARRKCPWKLLIQIVKIILITVQLIQFGFTRSSFVEYVHRTGVALKHLYLKEWQSTYETMPYPSASGPYAVYTIDALEQHIKFVFDVHNKTDTFAIGSLRLPKDGNGTQKNISMCLTEYKNGTIFDNDTYSIDPKVSKNCVELQDDVQPQLDLIDYDRLLILELQFSLKAYRLEMNQRQSPPQCFVVDVTITFDDSNKDGQMLVSLDAPLSEFRCKGDFFSEEEEEGTKIWLIFLDSFIILLTLVSSLLCLRSLWRGEKLKRSTVTFFKKRYGKTLSFSDRMEFLNFWYVTIIINDVMTIVGSALKLQLETRNLKSSSNNYDMCAIMLGTGTLLAWLGVLRYIGFFKTFNIVILTLKRAAPNMVRFLVCALILYAGFMFCGWVVIGPYHIKFKSLSSSSECLFALINGDDMFVTFSATVTNNDFIWYYSRIYLYLFISLFIYAVLNLFMALVMETYETIKEYYEHGFPKSELFQYIDECKDTPQSSLYRKEDSSCNPFAVLFGCCCCWKRKKHKGTMNEYSNLVRDF